MEIDQVSESDEDEDEVGTNAFGEPLDNKQRVLRRSETLQMKELLRKQQKEQIRAKKIAQMMKERKENGTSENGILLNQFS